jgi:hypothetical protein
LIAMLGKEFDGVLGCDYFSAYRKYLGDFGVAVQFCLAHLIRDVKFLTELPDPVTAAYGQRVLERLRKLFHVIPRREAMDPVRFRRALEKARDEVLATGKGDRAAAADGTTERKTPGRNLPRRHQRPQPPRPHEALRHRMARRRAGALERRCLAIFRSL